MRGYDDHARQRLSGSDDDYRGTFARDRDRVLYSSAFRRLAGKTQVVAAGELGDFHTRMTHSLKVAQLGRRLAEKLRHRALEAGLTGFDERYPIPDPELVEAACLAHDLGHPPFGHAGEEALTDAFDAIAYERVSGEHDPTPEEEERVRLMGGFEGNAQTFRILVRLSARPPMEPNRGLDLSRATLAATIKYPWTRGAEGIAETKWNAYPDDEEVAEWARDGRWGNGEPKTFEADIMDWCDDVTYACHDVEDFYRAGIIPLDRLFAFPPRRPGAAFRDEPEEVRPFFDYVARRWGGRFDRDRARDEWLGIYRLMSITEPYSERRASRVALHRSTSQLITYFLDSVDWEAGKAPCLFESRLTIEPSARLRNDLLQELIKYYVIDRPALASQQIGQQQIVSELLNIYVLGDEHDRLLPVDMREELERTGDLLRVATDHVASLTEPTAIALFHRLTGIRTGLHSDPYWKA